MKSFAVAAALVGAAIAAPQAATTSYMSPSAPAPSGCSTTYPGSFQISVTNVTFSKRDLEENLEKRAALTATLNNGVLRDNQNRIGEIVANRQFQFDVIVQSGAIYTAGWSVCSNGTLALGNSAVFYQCLSGNFYNLYDRSQGAQCSPIFINVIGAGSASTTSVAASATQVTDGQVQASTRASTAAVSQITDGQVQASTGRPVTQITDGQIQASTRATTSSARPVTQISDGQIQASTRAATTSSARPVSQISDGQIQATTGRPVTQISDGQIQATTARSSGAVVTQISDGQIQATTGRNASTPTASRAPTVSAFTGAAAQATAGVFAMVAGGLAMALL